MKITTTILITILLKPLLRKPYQKFLEILINTPLNNPTRSLTSCTLQQESDNHVEGDPDCCQAFAARRTCQARRE